MKNILKIFLAVFMITALWSCQKDEKKVIFEGGKAPVLSSSLTGEVPLSFATQNDQAFKLNWTNPDYKFNTGVSSMDVNYNILIDKSDKFDSPDMKTLSVGTDLSKTFTQGEFNDILLNQLQLDTTTASTIYVRVDAFLTGGAEKIASNTLSVSAKPYAIPPKVKLPVNGELFLVGDATAGGWNNPVPVPSQQFTKVTPTLYEITIDLVGGKQYLAIPVNGDWSHKYAVKNGPAASGGDFG